jgi:hypothetical protein
LNGSASSIPERTVRTSSSSSEIERLLRYCARPIFAGESQGQGGPCWARRGCNAWRGHRKVERVVYSLPQTRAARAKVALPRTRGVPPPAADFGPVAAPTSPSASRRARASCPLRAAVTACAGSRWQALQRRPKGAIAPPPSHVPVLAICGPCCSHASMKSSRSPAPAAPHRPADQGHSTGTGRLAYGRTATSASPHGHADTGQGEPKRPLPVPTAAAPSPPGLSDPAISVAKPR